MFPSFVIVTALEEGAVKKEAGTVVGTVTPVPSWTVPEVIVSFSFNG